MKDNTILKSNKSYIRKPIDFTHFAEAVQHMELYGLVLNEQLPAKEGFQ
jgi:hypothetical protein